MSVAAPSNAAHASLSVEYVRDAGAEALLAGTDVLAVFGFGGDAPAALDDPRYLHVPLQPHGRAPLETWRVGGDVSRGRDGDIAWATDGALSFGAIEVDERGFADADDPTGILGAARHAYARMTAFVEGSDTPYLLRIWLFASPVLYYADEMPQKYQFLLNVNPLGQLLSAWSDAINLAQTPSTESLVVAPAWAFGLLIAGFLFFVSREREFAVRL